MFKQLYSTTGSPGSYRYFALSCILSFLPSLQILYYISLAEQFPIHRACVQSDCCSTFLFFFFLISQTDIIYSASVSLNIRLSTGKFLNSSAFYCDLNFKVWQHSHHLELHLPPSPLYPIFLKNVSVLFHIPLYLFLPFVILLELFIDVAGPH